MPTRRRNHRHLPVAPLDVADTFASDFEVHDWEDWCRLVCWVEVAEPDGDGELAARRRRAAAIVIPRSSLPRLARVLRQSVGHGEGRRH